jgi:GT2 family glycosyltransferase
MSQPRKHTASSGPTASIVIPVHNGAQLTRHCLNTLLRQELGWVEIIVVDDASRDQTPRLLEQYADSVRVVRHESNTGFATACNDGAALANGKYLVFLNNDTVPRTGWLDTLVEYAEEHPQAGVVGCRLLFSDDTVQHAGVAFSQDLHPQHIYHGFPGDHPAVTRSRKFKSVTAACALFRRELFERAGGFDAGFVNGFEDVDLCLKIGDLGFECHYCHDCVVYHLESATRGLRTDEMDQNFELLLSRWGSKLEPDDIAYYLEDGLIQVTYPATHELSIQVSPLIGSAAGEVEDLSAASLLRSRAEQVLELIEENEELRRQNDLPSRATTELDSLVSNAGDGSRTIAMAEPERADSRLALSRVSDLRRTLEPLSLRASERVPQRLNVLVAPDGAQAPEAYVAAFQLAARVSAADWRARAVLVRDEGGGKAEVTSDARHLAGDGDALDAVEVTQRFDRSAPLLVNPKDVFMASNWWTAHLAHAAARELGGAGFLYLVEEFEPATYPMGSYAAAAMEAHGLPHFALFSTEPLRDLFAERRLGVFAEGEKRGQQRSLVFRDAIVDVGEVTAEELAARGTRRLLVDARRKLNLLELALLAIEDALSEKLLEGWELTGVTTKERATIELQGGTTVELVPAPSPVRLRGLLRSHDLALSLASSPRLSLAAIEMASAGMPVITNTFATKTEESLEDVSENLIACAPTAEGVAQALRDGLMRVGDYDRRAKAAKVSWSKNWDECFDAPVIEAASRFLRRCVPKTDD